MMVYGAELVVYFDVMGYGVLLVGEAHGSARSSASTGGRAHHTVSLIFMLASCSRCVRWAGGATSAGIDVCASTSGMGVGV